MNAIIPPSELSPQETLDLTLQQGFEIELDEPASAGYVWSASFDGDCAEVEIHRLSKDEQHQADIQANEHTFIGAPHPVTLRVWPKSAGQGVLHMVLKRPWVVDDEPNLRQDVVVRVSP